MSIPSDADGKRGDEIKYCKYCGAQIPDEAGICPVCKRELKKKDGNKSREPGFRGIKPVRAVPVVLAIAAAAFAASMLLGAGKCQASGCGNKAVSGSDYCYNHKCAVSDCNNSRLSYSNYCYTHYLLYDDDAEDIFGGVYASDLNISDVDISTDSLYTVAEGSVTNEGDKTVSFVKIKGSFKDSMGKVIDTDWTYAVGSEGLAPGESCKWRMSVDKDRSIKKCEVSIIDFDY